MASSTATNTDRADLSRGVIINLKYPHFFQFMQYIPKKMRESLKI